MGMVPSVVRIAPVFLCYFFILYVGEKRGLDSVRPCTVSTVSIFVCTMVCSFIVRQFFFFFCIFIHVFFNDVVSNVMLHSVRVVR